MNNSKKIRKLIQRFFDGETTLAEERLLYDFFASDNVPNELAEYKEMFAGYAAIWQAEEVKNEVCGMADGNGSKAGYKTSVIKRLANSFIKLYALTPLILASLTTFSIFLVFLLRLTIELYVTSPNIDILSNIWSILVCPIAEATVSKLKSIIIINALMCSVVLYIANVIPLVSSALPFGLRPLCR